MALTVFISLSLLFALLARFAAKCVHFFEAVFTVTFSIFVYLCYFGITSFNYGVFGASQQLGPFSCLLIMGFITVPSVVLIAASMGAWRDSPVWKLLVWLGSSGVLLGMEALAVQGRAIEYYDWSMRASFAAWIVVLAVLHVLVRAYRRLLRKEVRIP